MQSLSEWRRIRRYAVPDRMIAECTEARERGDWRAACEAGRIDVVFHPAVAAQAEESARWLAPDLLRWHLPRAPGGSTLLAHERRYVLVPDGPIEPDAVVLTVRTPLSPDGSQRLTLEGSRAADLETGRIAALPAYLWDARHAGDLRDAVGGSARRVPLFTPVGDPVPAEELGIGDLVWRGRLTPADLHPLVRAALFPGVAAPAAVAGAGSRITTDERIRVRCRGGDWHEIGARAGRLDLLAHPPAEQQRERSVSAQSRGCFAVEDAWHGTSGRLPKGLRVHREDLWLRMIHGGTRTVLDLLDMGMDPHLRDGRGRTLMHRIRSFEHARLLPRLVQEGLDVNARDREGNTPLYIALVNRWPTDLVEALIESGADPHAPNRDDLSVAEYVDRLLKYRHARDARSEAVIACLRPLIGSASSGGPVRRLQRWARTIMGDRSV